MKMSHKIVAVTLSVAVMGSILYMSSSNESEYTEIVNKVAINNKKQKDLQAEKKVNVIQDAPPGGSGSSNTSTTQVKPNGKLIEDPSINPGGVPMYDGLSLQSNYTEFDLEAFRNSRPEPMSYIGDYTHDGSPPYEMISTEYNKANKAEIGVDLVRKNADGKTGDGRVWTIGGRMNIVMPMMPLLNDEDRAKIEPLTQDNSRYGPHSWLKGCLGMREQDHTDSSPKNGAKIDLVMDDGRVLACILVDAKDIQYGFYNLKSGKEWYDSRITYGYAHYIGDSNKNGMRLCLLETNTAKESSSSQLIESFGLKGHKIVKVITYRE